MLRSSEVTNASTKTEAPIKPGEQLVLDLVMNGQRHFRAIRPDLGKIHQPHQLDVAAN